MPRAAPVTSATLPLRSNAGGMRRAAYPLLESPAHARLQASRPEAVLPRARAAGAGALARARRLRPLAGQPRGRRGLELLRGPADGERPARLPPRALARLQGRLPALPHDARLPGAAQGGLGLPRAAGRARGRKGARHRLQAGGRGVRDRQVQRALPRLGLRVRRGVEPADRADRLLDRPRRPLRDAGERLHRVGLVVAAPALGRATALRGAQGRPLLPALRHGALLARGRARLPGRQRPVDLPKNSARLLCSRDAGGIRYGSVVAPASGGERVNPGAGRPVARMDDDPLDVAGQRGGRCGAGCDLRQSQGRRRGSDPCRAAGRAGAGRER